MKQHRIWKFYLPDKAFSRFHGWHAFCRALWRHKAKIDDRRIQNTAYRLSSIIYENAQPKAGHFLFVAVFCKHARKHSRLPSSIQAIDLPLSLPCANFFGENNTQLFSLLKSAYRLSSIIYENAQPKAGHFLFVYNRVLRARKVV